jgi:hypothetical protein
LIFILTRSGVMANASFCWLEEMGVAAIKSHLSRINHEEKCHENRATIEHHPHPAQR